MALLEVSGLKFKYTDQDLYNNVDFRILEQDHTVIVGKNGSGKSTFLNIIAKNIIPDAGKIEWTPHIKYSYLDQHLKIEEDITISKYIYGVFEHLFLKEKKMNDLYNSLLTAKEYEYDRILSYAQSIQDELERENFYAINSTIGNIVNGLGIDKYGLSTKLSYLSGGQRAKVYLAKMLLEESDVLLMDEPTNFLDKEHVEWLIKYLNNFKGAFVVVSHDESFASQICNVVYALENKVLTRYKGDYNFYLKEREIRQEHMIREYENQQRFIKQTEAFIKAHIVRATSAKAAKQRVKVLDKLVRVEKPKKEEVVKIDFPFSRNLGQEVLKIYDLVIGYNKPLLEPLNILIKQNEKVAILGQNGVGKSTLLKTIMNDLDKISGEFKFCPSADINYFTQEHKFSENETPISYIRGFYPLKEDGEIRSVLARVGIKGDLALKKLNECSGGEQTRVRIALMTMKKSNILILDEPTNHLDKNTKNALYEAIYNFPGSVILVSHERDFYDGLLDYEIIFE